MNCNADSKLLEAGALCVEMNANIERMCVLVNELNITLEDYPDVLEELKTKFSILYTCIDNECNDSDSSYIPSLSNEDIHEITYKGLSLAHEMDGIECYHSNIDDLDIMDLLQLSDDEEYIEESDAGTDTSDFYRDPVNLVNKLNSECAMEVVLSM